MSNVNQRLFELYNLSAAGLVGFKGAQVIAEQITTSPSPVLSGVVATAFVGLGMAACIALPYLKEKLVTPKFVPV